MNVHGCTVQYILGKLAASAVWIERHLGSKCSGVHEADRALLDLIQERGDRIGFDSYAKLGAVI